MHLVINATELGRQRGGNETYISGLINGLATLKSSNQITLLTCDWGQRLHLPSGFRQINLGPYRRLPFFLWQQTIALRRLRADWYLSNYFLPLISPCRGAVVVHDLSFRAHPGYYPRTVALYMNWLTGLSIRQASCILTESEFSRQELMRFYPVANGRVVVIPLAVDAELQPLSHGVSQAAEQAILARYGITPPYIFALGNIHPRKNLARLLDAYLYLSTKTEALPSLVWGGLERWASGPLVDRARAAGVIIPGFIAQEDLPTLYRQAEFLVYPSLYEGFGLPPVEAMACGTPVITSNTSSLPEVVGEAALTVDPTSTEEIAAAMAHLLADSSLRQRLRLAGLERVKRFSWQETARRLLNSLEM